MSRRLKRIETFSLDVTNARRTPEGFLVVPMDATRTGVLTYLRDGKLFNELRLPGEVFNQDSMDSLALKPIVDGHPYEEPDGRVHAGNARRLQVGMTGENIKPVENRFLRTTAVITDDEAIKKVEEGKRQVSCGYEKEIELTSGYWDGKEINQDGRGEHFDAIQRNIRYNHVALVNRGRAGDQVRLHLDEDYNLIEEDPDIMLVKITVDGKEIEVSADAAELIKVLQKKALDEATKRREAESKITQDAEGKLKIALDENAALKAENATLKGSMDQKDAQIKDVTDPAKFNKKVQDRTHLLTMAKALMGTDSEDEAAKLDGLTDLDVMKTTLKHLDSKLDLDGKDENYIRGRFDTAADAANADADDKPGAGKTAGVGAALHQARESRKTMDDAETAQAISTRAAAIAWKFSLDEIRQGKHFAEAKRQLGIE